jgi:predicted NUDIX family phosphoesterase
MNNAMQKTSIPHKNLDEYILVVPRTLLFFDDSWQGFKLLNNFEKYTRIISEKQQFLPRSLMETDPTYKQVIPYLIFQYNDRYFLMQRQAKASETRLQSKFTLGIGGHIRKEDMQTPSIVDWAQREFHEEVDYTGNLTIKPLGIINDDSNEVGKVHVGFVFLLQGDSDQIQVKSELAQGRLATLEECLDHQDRMETWSQLVLPALQNS